MIQSSNANTNFIFLQHLILVEMVQNSRRTLLRSSRTFSQTLRSASRQATSSPLHISVQPLAANTSSSDSHRQPLSGWLCSLVVTGAATEPTWRRCYSLAAGSCRSTGCSPRSGVLAQCWQSTRLYAFAKTHMGLHGSRTSSLASMERHSCRAFMPRLLWVPSSLPTGILDSHDVSLHFYRQLSHIMMCTSLIQAPASQQGISLARLGIISGIISKPSASSFSVCQLVMCFSAAHTTAA